MKKFGVLIISILLIVLVYGGLNIFDLKKQIAGTQNNQNQLESKLRSLETKNNELTQNYNDLASNNTPLVGTIAYNITQPTITEKVVQTVPVIKTITKNITTEKVTNRATVTIENVGSFPVELKTDDTAMSILLRAGKDYHFAVDYDTYSFGVFVKSINGINPKNNQFWAFYYNGSFSNVGASAQKIKNGDQIFWQLSSF